MKSPFKRALPWLMAEGALAMSYDTLVGPIYLSAWAGSLGLPQEKLPWLTSLPLLGSVGQLFGVLALSRLNLSLKWLCIALCLVARSLWAVPFVLPMADPESIGVIAALSAAIGLTSTSFWMSWMKGWVPRRFEGRFWGVRARGSTLGVLGAHALAGLALSTLDTSISPSRPFAFILVLALLSALSSIWILARLPKSQIKITPTALRSILRSRSDLKLIGVACLFHAGISLVGPYFPYYFTKVVGLKSSEIAFWYGMTQLGMMLSALIWGKRWDHAFAGSGKNPKHLLRFTGTLLALSPLPYILQDAAWLRWIGPIEYFINGLIWAGFQIGLNTILFRSAGREDPNRATLLFTVLTAAQGITGALAAWGGSHLVLVLGSFSALWILGTCIRLVIAWFVLPRLI